MEQSGGPDQQPHWYNIWCPVSAQTVSSWGAHWGQGAASEARLSGPRGLGGPVGRARREVVGGVWSADGHCWILGVLGPMGTIPALNPRCFTSVLFQGSQAAGPIEAL